MLDDGGTLWVESGDWFRGRARAVNLQHPWDSTYWRSRAGVFGCEILYEDLWRSGRIPIVSMRVGANVINVHAAASPASPHAHRPTPGSGDICFRWEGPLQSAIDLLTEHDVPIVEGPVPRPAADGQAGRSIYFRDPDDNLMELLSTDD